MKVSSCWAESLCPLQKAFLLPKHSWSLLPPWMVKRRPCVPGLIFIITTLLLLGFISSFWWLLAYNWVCFSIPCDLGYVIAIDFSLPGPSFVLTLSWSVSRTAVNGCPFQVVSYHCLQIRISPCCSRRGGKIGLVALLITTCWVILRCSWVSVISLPSRYKAVFLLTWSTSCDRSRRVVTFLTC